MSNLNFGAAAPIRRTINIKRGKSTLLNPKTATAKKAWDRSHPQSTLADDMADLRLLPYNEIHRKLILLNPRMLFRDIGDGRVIIGVDHPSSMWIDDYERLDYRDRKEIDTLRETPGPRIWLIAASQNSVEPYTELVSRGKPKFSFRPDPMGGPDILHVSTIPSRVICRSLATIVKACVEGGAFTYEAAERVFGLRFRGRTTTIRYLDISPQEFHARKAIPELTPN